MRSLFAGLGGIVFHLDCLGDILASRQHLIPSCCKQWKKSIEEYNNSDAEPPTPSPSHPDPSSTHPSTSTLQPIPSQSSYLVDKESHLQSLQIIQAFVESFPQFLLQTAALFIKWTSGTDGQCFPGNHISQYLNNATAYRVFPKH